MSPAFCRDWNPYVQGAILPYTQVQTQGVQEVERLAGHISRGSQGLALEVCGTQVGWGWDDASPRIPLSLIGPQGLAARGCTPGRSCWQDSGALTAPPTSTRVLRFVLILAEFFYFDNLFKFMRIVIQPAYGF